MIRIAVCDDNERDLEDVGKLLRAYIEEIPDFPVELYAFSSSFELLSNIEKNGGYDAYLLDVLMPGMTGLDIISDIRKTDERVPVVIFTNSKEYALEAYSLDVCQYLLKPVSEIKLKKCLNQLFEGLRRREQEYIILHLSGGISRVQLNNIICVELSDHIMSFYMANGAVLESKYLRKPFAEAVAPLLNDSRFLRPHHSFIINMNYVDKMTKQYFFMKNGRMVKIAKQKSKDANTQYLNYLSSQWRS